MQIDSAHLSYSCSVVITCFNLELYIGESIQSVVDQYHSANAEIIVVDDCSTDGSAEIIKSKQNVRYIKLPHNSGVLMAMIAGVEAASNDIVFLLDGDDTWEREKLRHCLSAFRDDEALGFITHDLSFVDADGLSINRHSRPGDVLGGSAMEDADAKVRNGILALGDYVWLGSAIGFRRSLTRFDEFAAWVRMRPDPRNIYQDWPFAYWAAAQSGMRLGYIDAKLFNYRLHGANHSGDAGSIEKARRNFGRTLATSEAMAEIARRYNLVSRYQRITNQQESFYRYLVYLYSGHRSKSLFYFLKAIPLFTKRPQIAFKEIVRFAAISAMGPERFANLLSSRSK